MLPINVLKKLREEIVFYKKKDLSKIAVTTMNKLGGRQFTKKYVKSGLPMSSHYGWFTPTFLQYYAPEKMKIANMDWCIDRGGKIKNKKSVFKKLADQFGTYKVQKSKVIKGNVVQYDIEVLNRYKPEDAIDILSKNPNLVNHVFLELKEFVHKKLVKVQDFHTHDCALAIILARLDAIDYDIMAIQTQNGWFDDKEFGFGSLEWGNIINVLVAYHYFCKTHGDGTRKGLGIKTCEGEPETFDEANYVPSLLIPDVNIAKLFTKHSKRLEKIAMQRTLKEHRRLKKNLLIGGQKRTIPVEFVTEGLDPTIQNFVDAHPNIHNFTCMRTFNEFLENCQLLGFRFDGDVLDDVIVADLRYLYENITKIALSTNYKYSTVIHVVTQNFKMWCKNIHYRSGAFKDAVQYIMFGRTSNKQLNHTMGIVEQFQSIYNKIKDAVFKAKL